METARGRWFLTEYAKRNRNADTRMVLDAVERIEQSLAAQKEESLQKEEDLAGRRTFTGKKASTGKALRRSSRPRTPPPLPPPRKTI